MAERPDPTAERFPLWLRPGERTTADIQRLIAERWDHDRVRHERPLTPAEKRAHGT